MPEETTAVPRPERAPETVTRKPPPMWLLAGENEDDFDEPSVCRGFD
ncbi:hypothetical protein AB0N07_41435 [Streptomyces sp. NPDC051172]